MDSDSSEWQPPSEAEQKLMQARRDRADKISKIMGDYLLKGWKMMSSYCDDCGTILIQDRQGKIYCIACNELNSDTDKDNPATNVVAAQSHAKEHQRGMGGKKITTTAIVCSNGGMCSKLDSDSSDEYPLNPTHGSASAPLPRKEPAGGAKERPKKATVSLEAGSCSTSQVTLPHSKTVTISDVAINVDDTQDVLIQKLQWATDQLKSTTSVELCTQLCQLIKAAAEALHAIKQLNT